MKNAEAFCKTCSCAYAQSCAPSLTPSYQTSEHRLPSYQSLRLLRVRSSKQRTLFASQTHGLFSSPFQAHFCGLLGRAQQPQKQNSSFPPALQEEEVIAGLPKGRVGQTTLTSKILYRCMRIFVSSKAVKRNEHSPQEGNPSLNKAGTTLDSSHKRSILHLHTS